MLGVVVALIAYVMPMFNEILTSMGGAIPPFTRAILDASLFLSDNILWLLGIILLLVLVPLVIRTTVRGRELFSRIGFIMPVQKDILASGLASRFARNLGLLNRSGINMITSMEMIKTVMGNPYLEGKIQQAAELLKKGESFDKAIASLELFPPILIKLMAVAYGTGHIDRTLEKAAMVMEGELDSRLEKLTTVIEPLMIIVLSVFVGIILLSVILPVAGIINTLG
jgi:type IV pilus assembly protein PilC